MLGILLGMKICDEAGLLLCLPGTNPTHVLHGVNNLTMQACLFPEVGRLSDLQRVAGSLQKWL